jgi:putative endonuclease
VSRAQGFLAEEKAAAFLKNLGYTILDRNVNYAFGELDIVAEDKKILVFVEVKQRLNTEYGDPLEAVTLFKQRKIIRAAKAYLSKWDKELPICRFDVISIVGEPNNFSIEHILDAFWAEY